MLLHTLALVYVTKMELGQKEIFKKLLYCFKKQLKKHAHGQYNLGLCYEAEIRVKQDEQKAIELYEKAAEQGYIKAQNKVYFFKYNDKSK